MWDGHVPLLMTVIIDVLFSINLHFPHKEKIPAVIPIFILAFRVSPKITGLIFRRHYYMKI